MRSSRLMAILLVLQRRRHVTAEELATELEVSVRTIYRDVGALMAAGVPLMTERGIGGGIRLLDGWRTRLDGLTRDEAAALALAGARQALVDLGLATVALHAQTKVDATLPEPLRTRVAEVRERFLLDARAWFAKHEPVDVLPTLAEALWSGRRLDLVHGSRKARRRVDPLGLVLKAGTWYLVARHRAEVRTYRVSRIARATVRDERVARPPGFDLERTWRESTAAFDRALLRYPCRVRLAPTALRRVPDVVPNDAVRAMLEQAGPPDDEGWRAVALELESEAVALDQLAALGDGVEVIEPASLREALYERALRMAARNAPQPRASSARTSSSRRA